MARKLQLEDLEKTKQKIEGKIDKDELVGLYDLIIPPGTPSYIIYDMLEEFDLEAVNRKMTVDIVESDDRELIALRGSLEEVQDAEKFLHDELTAWVNED